ncbi:hypothetical protein HETIRDRAFT_108584 [Heterobasidion irregulare TC 32-1]|uniref:Uncharacterized protein n=1 Tax=Heterobasidion irregulare (strain TC 32-1) TaxID=747525 RepID=W4JMI7_HETIT|nr:uncharacterized protein HETIRDRAFT_108584 [Heterobasidion irregulare TC 32-1]ETW74684.1 hypothetical protein HETIRDRAFT_108584 [Heterobasidion irregulare TC 32-1]
MQFEHLLRYVERWDPTIAGFIDIVRLWCFKRPIRRSSDKPRTTPGCIRVQLYATIPAVAYGPCLDQVDFPLEPNGDFDLHQVKVWWDLPKCRAMDRSRCAPFYSMDPEKLSALAVSTLAEGKRRLAVVGWTDQEPWEPITLPPQDTLTRELGWICRAYGDNPGWYLKPFVFVALIALMLWEWPSTCAYAGTFKALTKMLLVYVFSFFT